MRAVLGAYGSVQGIYAYAAKKTWNPVPPALLERYGRSMRRRAEAGVYRCAAWGGGWGGVGGTAGRDDPRGGGPTWQGHPHGRGTLAALRPLPSSDAATSSRSAAGCCMHGLRPGCPPPPARCPICQLDLPSFDKLRQHTKTLHNQDLLQRTMLDKAMASVARSTALGNVAYYHNAAGQAFEPQCAPPPSLLRCQLLRLLAPVRLGPAAAALHWGSQPAI